MIVRRHHLAGDADGPEDVTRALFALHATDPGSVYLSVLARSDASTLADVAEAMYERRSLVRWMAMRRTLFVFARGDIPTVQAAVSTPLATTLRRRLITQLQRNGTEPAIDGDVGRWLARLEDRTEMALTRRGTATGGQLADDEPKLRTRILPRAPSDRPQNLTTSLLTAMSADGRLVRATPTGTWTSRQHRWEPISQWWPQGLPPIDPAQAQGDLARCWLQRFGPATTDDLQWWAGWSKATTRRSLDRLPIREVDLHGHPESTSSAPPTRPRSERETCRPRRCCPRSTPPPTHAIADRGAEAQAAIDRAAARLHARLDGAIVTPAIRTPLEKTLATGSE